MSTPAIRAKKFQSRGTEDPHHVEVMKDEEIRESPGSTLALLVARPLLIDDVNAAPASDDLIVRTDFLDRGSHLHEPQLSIFPNGKFTTQVNSVSA